MANAVDVEKCEGVTQDLRHTLSKIDLTDAERVLITKDLAAHCENLRDVNIYMIALATAFNKN